MSACALSSCVARSASRAATDVLENWPLAAGWAPCHGAPGSCTAKLTLGPDQQSAAGFCYEVVAKTPEEDERIAIEVYNTGDSAPIASSGGRANPVSASFCLESPSDPEPMELRVYSMERVPSGASVAIFREP